MSDQKKNLHTLIGRNLAAFQLLEYFVKTAIDLSIKKVKVVDEKLIENAKFTVGKITLGNTIPEFLKILEDKAIFPDSEDGFFFSLKFCWVVDDNERDEWVQLMKNLLEERNWLVHHSCIDFSLSNDQEKNIILKRVEDQFEVTQQTLERLTARIESMEKTKKNLAPFQFYLSTAIIILRLKKIKKDKDGWVLFESFASHFNVLTKEVRKEFPQIPSSIKMNLKSAKIFLGNLENLEFKNETINNHKNVYIRFKNSR